MDDTGALRGFDWEGAEDITALPVEDLRRRLSELSEEEKALSYRRRIVQGRLELIRAELMGRGVATLPPEELARVLLGGRIGGEQP